MVTEPLAALPPLSLPFRAAADEAAAAAGSMFWEAMGSVGSVPAVDRQDEPDRTGRNMLRRCGK